MKFQTNQLSTAIKHSINKTSPTMLTLGLSLCGLLSVSVYADNTLPTTVLPTMTIVVNRQMPNVGESTLNKNNIEQQQADNMGALLDILPGTSMSGSPRPSGQSLNIWGMGDTKDIKISLDGADKSFEKYRQGSIFIEPELLKTVVVDKGPFDASRSNGGFGGVVKLESKDAGDFLKDGQNVGSLVKFGYNTNNDQRQGSSALFIQNDSHTFDALLYGSMRRTHNIIKPDGQPLAFSANNQDSLLFKTNYLPNDNHHFTFSAMQGVHNAWEPWAAKRGDLPAPSESDINKYGSEEAWRRKLVDRRQKDQTFSLKHKYTPDNSTTNIITTLTHAKTKQHDKRPDSASKFYLGSMGNESWTTYKDTGLDIKVNTYQNLGNSAHNVTVGAQMAKKVRDVLMFDASKKKNADYHYGYFQPYYMPAGTQSQYALHIQDNIHLGNVTLSPALRYDYIINEGEQNIAPIYNDMSVGHDYGKKSYQGFSPFLGVHWQLHDKVGLFANVSRTWRAPVVDEQYEVQYAKASATASSLDLNPEKMTAWRAGGLFSINHLWQPKDSLQMRATTFVLHGKDEIFKNRGVYCKKAVATGGNAVCGTPISNYRNLPTYKIHGVELEGYYESPIVFGSLSYSAISGKRDGSPRNPWFDGTTWLSDIPPRKATVTLGRHFINQGINVGWRGEFIRHQDRSLIDQDSEAHYWALPKSSGYSLHGLFASWQPNKKDDVIVRLTIDNLFNKTYHPYLGESVDGVGRNFKLSVSWQF